MPTYTYRCNKCGEEIEAFQSMSDPPLKRCKLCRGALRRTFHPVGIVLKGSGFHRNDYRKPSSSSKSSSSEGSKSEKSTDGSKSEKSAEGSKSETSSGSRSKTSESSSKSSTDD